MVIYTSEGILDTYEGVNYPFNYAIGDVRDITKRNIDFSKTIKLPATKNNNKFFEYFFNVNVQSGSFDVNQKEFIRVEENGNIVFEGFLQLLSVTLQDGFNYYEAVVFSSFRNILDIVQNLDLSDLDFSEYNHIYEKETFKQSIQAQRKNYKYYTEKVNAGLTPNLQTMELGYGYTYPYISYDGTIQSYDENNASFPNAFPAFFVNEYIEKIFLLAGYKIESKFFETEYFRSLILPFTNGDLSFTQEELNSYLVEYNNGFYYYENFDGDDSATVDFILSNPTKVIDTYNAYDYTNNTIQTLTCKKKGSYYLDVSSLVSIESENNTPVNLYKNPNYKISFILKKNGVQINKISIPFEVDTNINNASSNTIQAQFVNIDLEVGDTLNVYLNFETSLYYNEGGESLGDDYYSDITDFDTTNNEYKLQLTSGTDIELTDKLDVSKSLPKIKITDFLKSIITMFNLYIYPKQDTLNTLIIETRDEFYNGNKTHFFDSKLDRSKPIKISTLSEESAKTYLYKYKEGKDYINIEYNAANDGRQYAQKEVVTDNQFLTNTQSYTSSFAASGNRFIDDFNVPVFFDREGNDIDGYTNKEIKLEPRILFYGGNGFASSRETLNYPTFSLDFEAMKQTSDADEWIPYFDLYNLFHKNTVEEVSSPNAKLLTCYLDLNVSEINIADKIYILGEYWRINKIIDYNANSNDTTKVELFKLKGNVNYLTAESIITDYENNTSKFNDKFNNQFS